MTDNEIKARRCIKHRLAHRAAKLRKLADELDAIAAQLDGDEGEPTSNGKELGPPT